MIAYQAEFAGRRREIGAAAAARSRGTARLDGMTLVADCVDHAQPVGGNTYV
jgi:hypothetical protein